MFGRLPAVKHPTMSKTKISKKGKAVVLLSGGLDSATVLYFAKHKSFLPFCLTFDYGQRHKREIKAASKIAHACGCVWQLVKFKLPWKGSALLDRRVPIPMVPQAGEKIPPTYVPARNIIFLSFAASFAQTIKATSIFIGANEVDFSGYPDCRLKFLQAFTVALKLGMESTVRKPGLVIYTPLSKMDKAQIVELAVKLNVPLALTWSCYRGERRPCGRCDSCRFRQRGFEKANIKDPLYV